MKYLLSICLIWLNVILISCIMIVGCVTTVTQLKIQTVLVKSIQGTIDSVVHIKNVTHNIQGSGVAWTEDIIVTARHIVEGGTVFAITLNNGMQIEATKTVSSKKYDIGFIKLNAKVLKPAKFGSIKDTVLGQFVYMIGSPYGKENFNSVALGIVSGLERDFNFYYKSNGWLSACTTDSAGHPGNSGCPVFTMDGEVIGIFVGIVSPVLGVCMPVDLFTDCLAEIEKLFEKRK